MLVTSEASTGCPTKQPAVWSGVLTGHETLTILYRQRSHLKDRAPSATTECALAELLTELLTERNMATGTTSFVT